MKLYLTCIASYLSGWCVVRVIGRFMWTRRHLNSIYVESLQDVAGAVGDEVESRQDASHVVDLPTDRLARLVDDAKVVTIERTPHDGPGVPRVHIGWFGGDLGQTGFGDTTGEALARALIAVEINQGGR